MSLRQSLHILLMLLMVMPSMACFKSICIGGAMAGSTMPCCRDMAAHKTMGVTLIKDCMNNDLGQAAVVKMPVPDTAFVVLGLIALILVLIPLPQRDSLLRFGRPPPDPYSHPFSILLATQRFRN